MSDNRNESDQPNGSALQVEVWECHDCRAPCRVEITFSDSKLPQHLKGNQRFRRMDCLCNERPDPLWVRMPNKEKSQ